MLRREFSLSTGEVVSLYSPDGKDMNGSIKGNGIKVYIEPVLKEAGFKVGKGGVHPVEIPIDVSINDKDASLEQARAYVDVLVKATLDILNADNDLKAEMKALARKSNIAEFERDLKFVIEEAGRLNKRKEEIESKLRVLYGS